ncbi:DUF2380 domain-containing protein [Botrimarina hoheduenensis]|uniref:Intein C-terminal splicing domain-containing protein n=1 Tax=Botrimarina hoheduenensis TaxID=2528000 RepID=A0A5C5WAW5_9BACT|nr:DUF2380 domain-containing protein [Botrimarina hoheduenensis]TWT47219.1 hypothetical protein Pla111_08310 [Botrimarina hoheduenensis]
MRPAISIFLLFAGVACLWRGLSVTAPAHEPVQARATQVSFSVPEVREQRIETIRVGQRVWIGENPSAERDHRLGVDIADPSQWRKMTLRCPKRDGTIASVQMLRPSAWLTERDVQVGGRVDIEVPECGIEGLASVLAIEPCLQIAVGPGRVVTATFHHQSARTFDLSIEGASEPIGVTGNHPVWCEETRDFVRVDTLRPGDHVRTTGGLARVASLSPRGPPESVYNLEVQLEHVYRVGELGLLVHNACAKPQQHHVFPQEFRHEFEDGLNIPIDDYTLPVPVDQHRKIHPKWNDRWQEFFDDAADEGRTPTANEARDFATELIGEFELDQIGPFVPFGR